MIVSQSFDRGRTWSAPVALALPGDQFMPWGAYDTQRAPADRLVRPERRRGQPPVLLHPGHRDRAGSLTFGTTALSTVRSDPTKGNRWFAATLDAAFPFATSFLGDYSNIAATPSGGVVAYWTDLRNEACFLGRCGHGEDAYFASAP